MKTQWDAAGEIQDKVFDDWMMDTKSKRGSFNGYWGWGDDWGYVHGEYLAEMNSYNPVKEQVQALDEYLNVAIWQNLMGEHQEDLPDSRLLNGRAEQYSDLPWICISAYLQYLLCYV